MKTHEFTLVLRGADDIVEAAERLYEVGCDDASPAISNGVAIVAFHRDAESLADAVQQSIHDVHAAGYQVERIEPSDDVTAAEIARRTGRSRESIRQLQYGQRGPGNFPSPVAGAATDARIWRWHQVVAWLCEHGYVDDSDAVAEAKFLAAANAVLDLVESTDSFAAVRRLWQQIQAA